jgi:UDP-3-O-[3-hydroxymyristoyl] glucosamine N-acyltransferase
LLITNRNPQEAFYRLFSDRGVHRYERLASRIDPEARIEPSAVIGDSVWIEADTYVGHNSVVLPNTYLGRGVIIKPNTTVGGDGFEAKAIADRLRIVPHAGGVWLEDGVEVGSSTCIDRGLFGEFTYLGRDTKVDNLVHVAHSVITGERVCLVACSEVSGTATLEDGVWLGPNASVNQLLTLGAHSYVGTASVVTRDLKQHSLAFGVPAKQSGWVCVCREKLDFAESARAVCVCGRRFELADEVVSLVS